MWKSSTAAVSGVDDFVSATLAQAGFGGDVVKEVAALGKAKINNMGILQSLTREDWGHIDVSAAASRAIRRALGRERSFASCVSYLREDCSATGTKWAEFAAEAIAQRAEGDELREEHLGFLTLAFRHFDTNKDNMLCADELRAALGSLELPEDDEIVPALLAEIDTNEDDVSLDEWLDDMPPMVFENLHSHPSAEGWRELAFDNHAAE